MGKCLSRWCDDEVDDRGEPVRNGHTVAGQNETPQKEPVDVVAAGTGHKLQPNAEGTPNTPRSVHVTMFVCQNGTHVANSGCGSSAGGGDCSSSDDVSDGCNGLFDSYRDPTEDCILADGVERLCVDLGVQPDDFAVLVLAWRFNVAAMCRFTRNEFVDGCRRIGVESLSTLSGKLPLIVSEVMDDRNAFRSLYQWSYRFALDPSAGQRTLPVDVAAAMWRVVFSMLSGGGPPVARSAAWLVPLWLEFVEHHSGVRGITRDTWDMFLNFVESLGDSASGLAAYDETEAWPSLFDDFVKWSHTRPRTVPTAWPDRTDQSTSSDAS
jgi:DCN1-like protein 3